MPSPRAVYYRLDFRPYRRKFLRPLMTAHGRWSIREGIIVRLMDADGRLGFGEAAPVPGFTPETTARDGKWLRGLGKKMTFSAMARWPQPLACARGALLDARAMLTGRLQLPRIKPLPVAALLPAGPSAVKSMRQLTTEGYRVFKWKIATDHPPVEFSLLEKLLAAMPIGGRLRLDANGGLTLRDWAAWCDGLNALGRGVRAIEFFEQPWPPVKDAKSWREQIRLAATAPVPVALDESVAGLAALRRARIARWPGPLVVKPALVGDRDAFKRWRARTQADLIYSSVFETSIGLHTALGLAASDPRAGQRALGFGTLGAFADDGLQLPAHAAGPWLTPRPLAAEDFLEIWNRLPNLA
jgi:O-succinylbenzoate synthase